MIDWRHWHNEPWLIGGVVVLGWLWAVLAGPYRARLAPGVAFPRRHAICFYSALLLFYFAVGSPLDQIGERFLFSAHMAQHQLLVYPTAVLFLQGIPSWMIDPVLSKPAVSVPLRLFTHPIIAVLGYALTIGLWHMPSLYDWALRDKTVHVVEHLMFFGAALFFWWPVVSPSRVLPRRPFGTQMLYILAGVITTTPTFAFITFSHDILYATYEFAPRLPGFDKFSAADDQLLAGSMMQLVGVFVALIAFGTTFYRWYEESGPAQPKRVL